MMNGSAGGGIHAMPATFPAARAMVTKESRTSLLALDFVSALGAGTVWSICLQVHTCHLDASHSASLHGAKHARISADHMPFRLLPCGIGPGVCALPIELPIRTTPFGELSGMAPDGI